MLVQRRNPQQKKKIIVQKMRKMGGKRGRLYDDFYNRSSISYSGMFFADWVGERMVLKKAGGTDEAKEEMDKLMQSKNAFVD